MKPKISDEKSFVIPTVPYSLNLRKKEKEFLAALYVKQEGKCALCQEVLGFEFHIDHDHESGFVRGLLCRDCNIVRKLTVEEV